MMSAAAFTLANHTVTWAGVLVAVAIVQWLLFMAIAIISPPPKPRKGPRPADTRLIVSSVLLGVLSFVALDGLSLVHSGTTTPAATAAVVPTASHATCAAVAPDMSAAQLEARLGKPDEIRPNDDVRGPGAALWIYKDARCAVALFDNKVELTE